MSEGSPPQRPPQISPDGKWVWDGTEWQPVAGRDSGHTAVFPAFNAAAIDPTLTAQPAPVPFQAPVAPVNYAANYSVPQQTNAPLWQVKPGHWNKYLYVAAGVIVLVMAGIFLSSIGPISLPWFGGTSQSGTPSTGPPPPSTRSDYAVAGRFLNGFFAPAMKAFNKTASAETVSCNGILTVGCQAALIEVDNEVKNAIAVLGQAEVPDCIAPSLSKFKAEMAAVDAALQGALQAYVDNSKNELVQGLSGFSNADKALQSEIATAFKVQASYCDTQLTGP